MHLPSVTDTLAWGASLADELLPGDVVALVGDLGAGKTHAAKGIVNGMGSNAAATSPTFSLVHEYEGGRMPVYHFDFYRLERAEEALSYGWDDYLEGGGVMVVEWANLFPDLFPEGTRWFHFTIGDDGVREVRESRTPPPNDGHSPH